MPKQGFSFEELTGASPFLRAPPHCLLLPHRWQACPYLEAVLLRHELLSFALVRGLQEGTGGLGGKKPPRGSVVVLRQVKVCHLHTDLVAHYVLELRRGRKRDKGFIRDSAACPERNKDETRSLSHQKLLRCLLNSVKSPD